MAAQRIESSSGTLVQQHAVVRRAGHRSRPRRSIQVAPLRRFCFRFDGPSSRCRTSDAVFLVCRLAQLSNKCRRQPQLSGLQCTYTSGMRRGKGWHRSCKKSRKNMRSFLKQAAHRRTRLFVPVVEYGLTELAVTVRQIAPRPVINFRGTLRLNRRMHGRILDWAELSSVSSQRRDRPHALARTRVALVDKTKTTNKTTKGTASDESNIEE